MKDISYARFDIVRFLKFACVGILNTIVTFVVFIFIVVIGFSPVVGNIVGYIVGVLNSFIWNKLWVFHTNETNVVGEFIRFMMVFGVCYGLQFLLFYLLIYAWDVNEYVSQGISMFLYTILNFILNKLFAFKATEKNGE